MAKLDLKQELQPREKCSSIEMGEIDDSKHPVHLERCPWKHCNKMNCRKSWHRPYSKANAVEQLKPVLVSTGTAQIIFGGIFSVLIIIYAEKFDKLFSFDKPGVYLSFLTYGSLIALAVSGMVLVTSVMLDSRTVLRCYIIASILISVYIFGLSIIMIQYGLQNVSASAASTMKYQEMTTSSSSVGEELVNQPKGQVLIPEQTVSASAASTMKYQEMTTSSSSVGEELVNQPKGQVLIPEQTVSTSAASTMKYQEMTTSSSSVGEELVNQPKGQVLIPEQTAPYQTCESNFVLGKAFVIGLLTLFGSVGHFVGTVIVFTYYNLKYIHPMMFYCHEQP